jgi:hypothetical protein
MIFIPGNVPSSKNSRIYNSKTKRSFPSKTVQRYISMSKPFWVANKDKFLDMSKYSQYPMQVHFLFVRGTKHRFDYINPAQTVQDLMVDYNWVPDDNADYIIPVFEPYQYDKTKPGVYIYI